MPNNMEEIIKRASMALGAGIPEEDIAAKIQEHQTPEIAFLAIQAAKILITPCNEENEKASE